MTAGPKTGARRARNAAAWALLQNGGRQAIDLLVFLALASWLAPEAFGLVAMVGAALTLGVALAELGMGDALVQRARLRRGDADTAFWALLASAGLLGFSLWLFAEPLARAYGHEELAPLLRALCPMPLLHALNTVPQALLQRRMAMRPLALRAVVAGVTGGSTAIALAACGAGPWALVGQQLAAGVSGTLVLLAACSWRPRHLPRRRTLADLAALGQHVVGTRLLHVLATKADDLVVGAVLGPAALGLYLLCSRLQLAMEQACTQGIDSVALSAFSRAKPGSRELAGLFSQATRTAVAWTLPAFGLAMAIGPGLLSATAGARWADAGAVLQVLLAAAFLHAVMHLNHAMLKATGRPELSTRMALGSTLLVVPGLALSASHGILAVAYAHLARTALVAPVGVVLACREAGLPVATYLRGWLRPLFSAVLGGMVYTVVQPLGQNAEHVAWQLVPGIFAVAAYALAAARWNVPPLLALQAVSMRSKRYPTP